MISLIDNRTPEDSTSDVKFERDVTDMEEQVGATARGEGGGLSGIALARPPGSLGDRRAAVAISCPQSADRRHEIETWSYDPAVLATDDVVDQLCFYLSTRDHPVERVAHAANHPPEGHGVVVGLQRWRTHLADYADRFVLVGGDRTLFLRRPLSAARLTASRRGTGRDIL